MATKTPDQIVWSTGYFVQINHETGETIVMCGSDRRPIERVAMLLMVGSRMLLGPGAKINYTLREATNSKGDVFRYVEGQEPRADSRD